MKHARGSVIFALVLTAALASPAQSAAQQPAAAQQAAAQQATAAFKAGYDAQQAGRLEEARQHFLRVTQLAPQVAEGHQALAAVFIELGRAPEAIPELQTAMRLKPGSHEIEAALAEAFAQSGQTAKALPLFKNAAESAAPPKNPAFYDSYARTLASASRPQDALKQFNKERELAGPRAEIDDAIGTMYAQLGQWSKAQQAFQQAIAEDPGYAPSRLRLAAVLRRQQQVDAALQVLAPLTTGEHPSAAALLEQGRLYVAAGNDGLAVSSLQSALSIQSQLPGAAEELAMALQRLGRQQEAIPLFEQALQQNPTNANVLANLGLAMTLTGKAKEALHYLEQANKLQPNSAGILKDRGVAHIQLSAFDEAIDDFKAAMALDPNDPQTHYDLGLAYKFKDRLQEAAAELAKAGEMAPDLEDPPYTLGILYMQMGKLDDAAAQLQKAVTLRPDNGSAWAILGSTLKQAGHLQQSREALEKAIPLQPGQPGPLVTLASVLAEQAAALNPQIDSAEAAGDATKAQQLRAQAKQLRTEAADYRKQSAALSQAAVNRQRANFALNAGNQLLMRGQISDAIARYQESIAADGTFPDPHTQLAVAYERQGRTQDAAAEREKAASLAAKP